MLLATIFTLLFGLLFLRSQNTADGIKVIIEISSVFVIVSSNLLVIVMTIWDIFVRRKNIGKRKKNAKIIRSRIQIPVFNEGDEYDFKYESRKWNVSSAEDSTLNMNEIIEDLFSFERLKRKLISFENKRKKVTTKVKQVKETISFDKKKVEEKRIAEMEEKINYEKSFHQRNANFLQNLEMPKIE